MTDSWSISFPFGASLFSRVNNPYANLSTYVNIADDARVTLIRNDGARKHSLLC